VSGANVLAVSALHPLIPIFPLALFARSSELSRKRKSAKRWEDLDMDMEYRNV